MTENKTIEKLYKRFDDLDGNDGEFEFDIESLTGMKIWLVDFWNENHDDMTDEELDELRDEIMESDESEMFERLSGIGYSFYELDEDENILWNEMLDK